MQTKAEVAGGSGLCSPGSRTKAQLYGTPQAGTAVLRASWGWCHSGPQLSPTPH